MDLRADIYSLGIIIGEMAERLKDKRLAAVSRRCTRPRPENRYPSAAAVVRDMDGKRAGGSLYRWGAVAASVLLVAAGYAYYARRHAALSSAAFPIYGNYSLPAECWPRLSDSTGVEQAVAGEFPLPAQRQSAAFLQHREALLGAGGE